MALYFGLRRSLRINAEPKSLLCDELDETLDPLFSGCAFSRLVMLTGPIRTPLNWTINAEFWAYLQSNGIKNQLNKLYLSVAVYLFGKKGTGNYSTLVEGWRAG